MCQSRQPVPASLPALSLFPLDPPWTTLPVLQCLYNFLQALLCLQFLSLIGWGPNSLASHHIRGASQYTSTYFLLTFLQEFPSDWELTENQDSTLNISTCTNSLLYGKSTIITPVPQSTWWLPTFDSHVSTLGQDPHQLLHTPEPHPTPPTATHSACLHPHCPHWHACARSTLYSSDIFCYSFSHLLSLFCRPWPHHTWVHENALQTAELHYMAVP